MFGKLKVKDKKIEHCQIEKPKMTPTAPGKKLTIRTLLEKDERHKKLPKLDELEKKNSDSFMDSLKQNKSRLLGGPKHSMDPNQSGNMSFIEKMSNKDGEEEDGSPRMESPTRRYKKKPIDIRK